VRPAPEHGEAEDVAVEALAAVEVCALDRDMVEPERHASSVAPERERAKPSAGTW
jgi:hypothetical protein